MNDQTIKRSAAKGETPKLIQMVCAVAAGELRALHRSQKKCEIEMVWWSEDRPSSEGGKVVHK